MSRIGQAFDDITAEPDGFDDELADTPFDPEIMAAAEAVEQGWDDEPPIEVDAEGDEPPIEEVLASDAVAQAAIEAEVEAALQASEAPPEVTPEMLQRADVITEQTAVLEWHFRGEGFTRKVNPNQVVADKYKNAAEAAMLRVSKKGIVCPELDAIGQGRKKFKKQVQVYRLPAGDLLRAGQILVPLRNVDAIDAMWEEFKQEDRELIRQFLVVYRREQLRAQQLQGDLYNPRHYPPLEKVAASFLATRRWLVMSAPAAMQEIHAAAFTEANARLRAQVAAAGVEMVDNLRAEAASWVNWLVEQLAVGEDGKRKSINEDKFANAQRFFALAGNLNVANDAEFAEVIKLGEAAIKGQDVAELKKGKGKSEARVSADALRANIAAQFEAIKSKTAGWVVNAPTGREVVGEDEA